MVTWTDVENETGETYTVYGSRSPITDVDADGVDIINAAVLEGEQATLHYIYSPLEDESQEWYYAVSCTDASQNKGEAGFATAVTNNALGIPTISLDPPAAFAADGIFDEWEASGIMPFEMNITSNSWGRVNTSNILR